MATRNQTSARDLVSGLRARIERLIDQPADYQPPPAAPPPVDTEADLPTLRTETLRLGNDISRATQAKGDNHYTIPPITNTQSPTANAPDSSGAPPLTKSAKRFSVPADWLRGLGALGATGALDQAFYGDRELTDWDWARAINALGTATGVFGGLKGSRAVRDRATGNSPADALMRELVAPSVLAGGVLLGGGTGPLIDYGINAPERGRLQRQALGTDIARARVGLEREGLELERAREGTATTGEDTGATGKATSAILAASALLGGVYLLNSYLDRRERANNRKGPYALDRVSLEIPSHKISDTFYNRMGREILFTDKDEASREDASREKAASEDAPMPEAPRAQTTLTDAEAREHFTPRAYWRWRAAQAPSSGPHRLIEGVMTNPIVANILGIRTSTFGQRVNAGARPTAPGNVNPYAASRMAQTMAAYHGEPAPNYAWSPGATLNLTSAT